MEARARAGIELHDTALRYAELERRGDRYQLLRLGSCDFDFGVLDELQAEAPRYLDIVGEALRDVLAGLVADELDVALHPSHGVTAFASLQPEALEPDALRGRLLAEASWITGQPADSLRLHAEPGMHQPLPEDERARWYQVLVLPRHVQAHLERVLQQAPCRRYRVRLSTAGAAEALRRLSAPEPGVPPEVALAIGCYETHTEFTLCRRDHWYLSHFAPGTEDVAYFCMALLHRLGLSAVMVEQVALYGTRVPEALSEQLRLLFPVEPMLLNPVVLTTLDPKALNPAEAVAYVPCIGVALT
ncbi:hypothetical protein Rhom172_0237 [Rhodothermus marinus SG0.5JP17-172]|jgi:hypothetical protein|uniref:hypothetical protein n=1 Tax=Rhodothermus marinus TaxID=29549 RepID=UPI000223D1E8|nr:hypothetical protein [Rhodothermus marinus]AEN72185.1 hypothetical protein Rhom172_0237 [Rhodothermus marinus SG0.5JP17-172]MBO2491026.1 hypothetical protein [Rhodothermus marinus]